MMIPGVDYNYTQDVFPNRNVLMPTVSQTPAGKNLHHNTPSYQLGSSRANLDFSPNPYYGMIAGITGLWTRGPWFNAGNATINYGSSPAGDGRRVDEPIYRNDSELTWEEWYLEEYGFAYDSQESRDYHDEVYGDGS